MLQSNLKQIVDKKGLRYGFIAKKVGIANSTMTNLLQGGTPTLLVAIRIAKVLDMRVENIWIEKNKEDT
ncbi:TPA: helix-turn-helix transcriptional regulator [Bacillus thuringiensis]|uniref:Helix-turn-helix transcriptional regulator n=2 Tax=Bacillus cereus group TaxID=86661 RepID=A0A643M0E8_BACTU|nr:MULTISPECIES: helix-turn-helix transcriptional regulator [Bacillus]AGE77878.1 Transcriptional regulator, pbsX [Bacillus thuringiensis serovar kurstaki str. HD73]AHZ50954.1 DNA-binding protein [Bacillus thuringiensis serovar kurstaki str. YBT-1520]AIE33364.1 DNA-binding protein [Bacillus thuringiensis serovar kurstaki str. HD-1]AIM32369.1 Transcriptional regulator, pbsX [Bacillus thuringiensis serovar kurstaki str. YBT-1520]AJK40455.1 helix-turn-helix family protein [Bacillus thuringiensis s